MDSRSTSPGKKHPKEKRRKGCTCTPTVLRVVEFGDNANMIAQATHT